MNEIHPLLKFAQETKEKFDVKKFRDQLVLSIAVAISMHYLKKFYSSLNEKVIKKKWPDYQKSSKKSKNVCLKFPKNSKVGHTLRGEVKTSLLLY